MRVRRWIASTVLSGGLAMGVAAPVAMSTPAGAQQQGLVNVEVTNVLNDNEVAVTVPINAAANVCGVSVNVLSAAIGPSGPGFFECTAGANQQFRITQ
jgi:hypothetical protein